MNRFIAAALVLVASVTFSARADVSAEKRKEIEKMLRLTGMEKLVGQMQTQMIASLKAQMPQASQLFWTKFQQKIDTRDLIEKLIC